MEPYTVTLTSCGRFNLLEATLATLLPRLGGPLSKILVSEDSGDEAVFEVTNKFSDHKIEVFLNKPALGQMRSIDNLYSKIDTDWIFHCEDDWEFFSEEFIEKSFVILKAFEDISMVSLRPRQELNPLVRHQPVKWIDSVHYFVADPASHPEYFGYSFNPGLRRLEDYWKVAPFSVLPTGERDVSYCFKRLGYKMAYLEEPACRHIGGSQHVHDPYLPRRPRTVRAKLASSIKKRWRRLYRKLNPSADPSTAIVRRQRAKNHL